MAPNYYDDEEKGGPPPKTCFYTYKDVMKLTDRNYDAIKQAISRHTFDFHDLRSTVLFVVRYASEDLRAEILDVLTRPSQPPKRKAAKRKTK